MLDTIRAGNAHRGAARSAVPRQPAMT